MIKLLQSKECLLCRWFNLVHPQNTLENWADDKLYKRIYEEVGFGKRRWRRDQITVDKLNWLFTPGSRRVTYPVLHSILTLCHIYCLFIGPHLHRMLDGRTVLWRHKIRRCPALALQFISPVDPNRWVNNTTDYTIKEFKEIDHKPAGNGWSCVYIWITCRGHICSIMEFTADLLTRN